MEPGTITPDRADRLLSALAEQFQARGASFELVVIGGAALGALGLVRRATTDIDVVGLITGGCLETAQPLPGPLADAARRVAADFGLSGSWLNAEPSEDLVRLGLPPGFTTRLITRSYGPVLTVHLASRLDQIHFKLFAMVDRGAGKHEQDLRALEPTPEELLAAARWARTHDPSEGFRDELIRVLRHLGVEDPDVD